LARRLRRYVGCPLVVGVLAVDRGACLLRPRRLGVLVLVAPAATSANDEQGDGGCHQRWDATFHGTLLSLDVTPITGLAAERIAGSPYRSAIPKAIFFVFPSVVAIGRVAFSRTCVRRSRRGGRIRSPLPGEGLRTCCDDPRRSRRGRGRGPRDLRACLAARR